MLSFRNGQWVRFSPAGKVPEGVHTAGGKVVGIFVKGGVDSTGEAAPDRIRVCDTNGKNLMHMGKDANGDPAIVPFEVDPATLQGLEAVVSRDDIPAPRLKTMNKDWLPRG